MATSQNNYNFCPFVIHLFKIFVSILQLMLVELTKKMIREHGLIFCDLVVKNRESLEKHEENVHGTHGTLCFGITCLDCNILDWQESRGIPRDREMDLREKSRGIRGAGSRGKIQQNWAKNLAKIDQKLNIKMIFL